MKAQRNITLTAMAVLLTAGCSATHHAADVREADEIDRVTVGTVQKEIVIGMSAADVASVLGSPTSSQRRKSARKPGSTTKSPAMSPTHEAVARSSD